MYLNPSFTYMGISLFKLNIFYQKGSRVKNFKHLIYFGQSVNKFKDSIFNNPLIKRSRVEIKLYMSLNLKVQIFFDSNENFLNVITF